MNKIDLLAPAGDMNKFDLLLDSKADSIFIGGKMLNLRAGTVNFSDEEIKEMVIRASEHNKKIYVTINAVPHNEELKGLEEWVKYLESIGVYGVIVSDMGVFQLVKDVSNIRITVQTHSSNTNWRSVKMWQDLGAARVVLDRDLNLQSIAEIRAKVPNIELEVFVHGPFCMAISGRTLISNFVEEKNIDKNPKGESFTIVEETRPGEHMPIYEDVYGTYIYSARDLCTIDMIEEFLSLGIDAIKIDGGMRDEEYLKNVVEVYGEAVELYGRDEFTYKEEWLPKLKKTTKLDFASWFLEI